MKSKVLLALVAVFLALPLITAFGECDVDPNERDTVRIGKAVIYEVIPGQFIDMPVYVYADEDLGAVSLGFKWSSTNIRYASVLLSQEVIDMGFTILWHRQDTVKNIIGVGTINFSGGAIPASSTARLIFTIRFMTKTGAVPSLITIDSTFFGNAGLFTLIPAGGGTADGICPEYVHSAFDISLGLVPGDADGSGAVSIADVVFLVNFIFSGGPSPTPLLSGDADCSGGINISDAVYLVRYIFGEGAAPCE